MRKSGKKNRNSSGRYPANTLRIAELDRKNLEHDLVHSNNCEHSQMYQKALDFFLDAHYSDRLEG